MCVMTRSVQSRHPQKPQVSAYLRTHEQIRTFQQILWRGGRPGRSDFSSDVTKLGTISTIIVFSCRRFCVHWHSFTLGKRNQDSMLNVVLRHLCHINPSQQNFGACFYFVLFSFSTTLYDGNPRSEDSNHNPFICAQNPALEVVLMAQNAAVQALRRGVPIARFLGIMRTLTSMNTPKYSTSFSTLPSLAPTFVNVSHGPRFFCSQCSVEKLLVGWCGWVQSTDRSLCEDSYRNKNRELKRM